MATPVAAEPPLPEVLARVGSLDVLGPGPDYVSIGAGAFDVVGEKRRRGVQRPSAAGRYRQGDSKDLGGAFEFRIGVEVVHMSNAYTRDINPGEEELHATVALPF